jgi:hypothetical protein
VVVVVVVLLQVAKALCPRKISFDTNEMREWVRFT